MDLPWCSEAALLAARLSQRDRALELVAEDLRLARAFGAPLAIGLGLRAAGLIEGDESGLELLADAVKTLERSQSPLELARALSDHGAALRQNVRASPRAPQQLTGSR